MIYYNMIQMEFSLEGLKQLGKYMRKASFLPPDLVVKEFSCLHQYQVSCSTHSHSACH